MKQTQHARLPPFRLQRNAEKTTERRKHQGRAEERPILRRGEETMAMEWKLHVELSGEKKKQSGACARRSIAGRRIVKKVTMNSTLMLCHVMYSMYGHWRSWAATVHKIFRVCSNPVWTELPLSSTNASTVEFTSKLQLVIWLKSQSEKLAAMENLARSCCNHHGTRAVAP